VLVACIWAIRRRGSPGCDGLGRSPSSRPLPLSPTLTRAFSLVNESRVIETSGSCYQDNLMSSAKAAKPNLERDQRRRLGLQLCVLPPVAVAADRAVRLVGLAADEDPELGLLGVLGLRQVARVCEDHQVRQTRAAGWTWAQIATALQVSPQAASACPRGARSEGSPNHSFLRAPGLEGVWRHRGAGVVEANIPGRSGVTPCVTHTCRPTRPEPSRSARRRQVASGGSRRSR
jgi:hypothetical protein